MLMWTIYYLLKNPAAPGEMPHAEVDGLREDLSVLPDAAQIPSFGTCSSA